MRVNYFLKDSKKEFTSVFAVVRYKGERYKYTTGVTVMSQYWDSSKHRCRLVREDKEADNNNDLLEKFETKLKTIFSSYKLSGIIPTKEMIDNDLKSEKKNKIYLTDLIQSHKDKSNYDKETKKKYVTALHWIEDYEKKHHTKLEVTDIDLEWYEKFRRWFNAQTYEKKTNGITETRHYSLNYFGSIIKCIKVTLKSIGREINIPDDVKDPQFRTESEESDTIYLTEAELQKIVLFMPSMDNINQFTKETRPHNLNRTIQIIDNIKKRFLIGCYTALRVSDFKRIDLDNVKKGFIVIKPKKGTKKNADVIIPIHPVVKGIIDSGFDFEKKVYDQDINQWIKEVCRVVGINDKVSVTRTEGGKQVERVYEKWQLVTTHTARRSGATNMFKAGIPSISIMKITGHKTEKSFLKYIKISAEENAEILAGHPFFK